MVWSRDNSKLPFVVQDRDQVEDLDVVKDKERIKTNTDIDFKIEAKVAVAPHTWIDYYAWVRSTKSLLLFS